MSAAELYLPPRPLLRGGLPLSRITLRVQLALLPALLAAVLAWGLNALLLCLATLLGALSAEWISKLLLGNRLRIHDGSALLSAMLICLTLPPGLHPGWGFAAAFAGILLGKEIFGGIGRNPVNPALLGRLLLSLVAPAALETGMRAPFSWSDSWFAFDWSGSTGAQLPELMGVGRVLDQALAGLNPVLPAGWPVFTERLDLIQYAHGLLDSISLQELVVRSSPGLMGELSILALLPGMIWLLATRVIDWRIPLPAFLLLPVLLFFMAGAESYNWLGLGLLLRGCTLLLLITVFAADPVTSPLGQLAKVMQGLLLALLLALGLKFSGQAGALFAAVLLVNLITPWLDWLLLPRGPRSGPGGQT